MDFLIDGYNLLHASPIESRRGRGELHWARLDLLCWLGEQLGDDRSARTTVVFDGRDAPPRLPDRITVAGMRVIFARDESADELIAGMIQASHHPRHLTVVSDDHQVQHAARRRRARAAGCREWLAELRRSGPVRPERNGAGDAERWASDRADIKRWMEYFGLDAEDSP